MAKRSSVPKQNKSGIKTRKKRVVPVSRVPLKIKIQATYKTIGKVSLEAYTWHGAGSVVDVLSEDVPHFLSKTRRKPCCGWGTMETQFLFEKLGE